MRTQYRLKRLDEKNVRRSIGGAVQRSLFGTALLMITTKPGHQLPTEYEQNRIRSDGSSFFEADTNGHVEDGCIRLFLLHDKKWPQVDIVDLPLAVIRRPLYVDWMNGREYDL